MIEKLKVVIKPEDWKLPVNELEMRCLKNLFLKVDELVGAVNKLETMAKNTNTVLESLVQENNIHEKQIDELQMKVEPEKCETPVDPYAEQRKWIGKLCKFWNDENGYEDYIYEILIDIDDSDYPYKIVDVDSKTWTASFKHCEPVSEDLIYKGGDNE